MRVIQYIGMVYTLRRRTALSLSVTLHNQSNLIIFNVRGHSTVVPALSMIKFLVFRRSVSRLLLSPIRCQQKAVLYRSPFLYL